jgi:hypothetical protein
MPFETGFDFSIGKNEFYQYVVGPSVCGPTQVVSEGCHFNATIPGPCIIDLANLLAHMSVPQKTSRVNEAINESV